MKKKLRIIEVCPFSAGICGVWARVFQESREFVKLGASVIVLSSDIEKGTEKRCELQEIKEMIEISRFKSKPSLLSKNVKYWFENQHFWQLKPNTIKKIEETNPDIIITHLLHPHSASISRLVKALKRDNKKLKIFIVPHAPFNVKRGFILDIATNLWRKFSGMNLNHFDKVIAITQWEIPYLLKLGIKRENIVYIPNGVPEEFFIQKKEKENASVLFLGRISSVKNIETLIGAAKLLPKINFSIVGAAEPEYKQKLENHIKEKRISNIKIYPPVYNLKEKIKLIDANRIFVLPSKREAMPQVLIEAMSRGKIVLASKTDGAKEIIKDGKTGFLFDIGNEKQLADLIEENISGNKQIQKQAEKEAEKYSWRKLIKSYFDIF